MDMALPRAETGAGGLGIVRKMRQDQRKGPAMAVAHDRPGLRDENSLHAAGGNLTTSSFGGSSSSGLALLTGPGRRCLGMCRGSRP